MSVVQVVADEIVFGPIHVVGFFAWNTWAEEGTWGVSIAPLHLPRKMRSLCIHLEDHDAHNLRGGQICRNDLFFGMKAYQTSVPTSSQRQPRSVQCTVSIMTGLMGPTAVYCTPMSTTLSYGSVPFKSVHDNRNRISSGSLKCSCLKHLFAATGCIQDGVPAAAAVSS